MKSKGFLGLVDLIPRWAILYATAIVPIFISFSYASYFLIFDNDPPSMPWSATSLDCAYIHSHSLTTNGSRIVANFTMSEFFEVPKSAAASLLTAQITSGNTIYVNDVKSYYDMEANSSHLSLTLLHPIIGNATVKFQCGKITISQHNITIGEINAFPTGFSRFNNKDYGTAEIFDACWFNETMLFFTNVRSYFNPMNTTSDMYINCSHARVPYAAFVQSAQVPEKRYPAQQLPGPDVFFLAAKPEKGYDIILDLIIPIWSSNYYIKHQITSSILLTHDQDYLIPIIRTIHNGEIMHRSDNICYGLGTVLPTRTALKYTINTSFYEQHKFVPWVEHMDHSSRIKPEIMREVRELFTSKSASSDRITVQKKVEYVIPNLKKAFPNAKIDVLIDTDDIKVIANIMAKTRLFVTAFLEESSYAIFMNPNTTVAEVLPHGFECTQYANRWAQMIGLNYAALGKPNNYKGCNEIPLPEYYFKKDNATMPTLTPEYLKGILAKHLDA